MPEESSTEVKTPEAPADGKVTIRSLLEEVGGEIKGCTDKVASRVKDTLVEREVQARADAMLACVAKLEDARKEEKKIQPDVKTFDADGKVKDESYTKEQFEKLKKAREATAKVESAINKALGGDFSKVKELAGK